MRIIGIVGGVAGGKSMVARQFAELGAGVLDADQAGHETLRLPRVEAAARQRWGMEIFGQDGHVDRAKLASVVFAPGTKAKEERKFLEQLTHPEIAGFLRRQADDLESRGIKIAVLDAALLFEAGWDELCEKIVFVDAPRKLRLSRALARGWTEKDFAAREGAQESLESKRTYADVIVDNSGPPEETQAQVERIWMSLASGE